MRERGNRGGGIGQGRVERGREGWREGERGLNREEKKGEK